LRNLATGGTADAQLEGLSGTRPLSLDDRLSRAYPLMLLPTDLVAELHSFSLREVAEQQFRITAQEVEHLAGCLRRMDEAQSRLRAATSQKTPATN
jgi:hypothetical protein